MRTLIFSCLHIPHKQRPGSPALKGTIDWLLWLVKSQSVTHVVFLGDAVHNVSRTDLPVNLWLRYAVDGFKALEVPVFWLVGNHDIYSETMNAMQVFEETDLFKIVQSPSAWNLDGCNLVFLPWMSFMDKTDWWRRFSAGDLAVSSQPNYLFCHAPIERFQAMVDPGNRKTSAPEDDLVAHFHAAFAGHYHGAGQDTVEVLGSPVPVVRPGCVLAQDFTDARLPVWFHGAVIWDFDAASPETFGVHWLANPCSHYFFKGTEAEYEELSQNVRIAPLLPRTHLWLTEEPTRKHEAVSVIVRPEKKAVEASSTTPYKLDSTPEQDLQLWLEEQDMDSSSSAMLVEKARKYFGAGDA